MNRLAPRPTNRKLSTSSTVVVPEVRHVFPCTPSEVTIFRALGAVRTSVDDVTHLTAQVDHLNTQMLLCSDMVQCASLCAQLDDTQLLLTRRVVEGLDAVRDVQRAQPAGGQPTEGCMVARGASQRMHNGLCEYSSRAVGDAAWGYVRTQINFLKRFEETLVRRLKTRYTHSDGTSISDQRAFDMTAEVLSNTTSPQVIGGVDPVLLLAQQIHRTQSSVREVCGIVSTCVRFSGDAENDLCYQVYSAPEFAVADFENAIRIDKECATVDRDGTHPDGMSIGGAHTALVEAPVSRRRRVLCCVIVGTFLVTIGGALVVIFMLVV